MGVLVEPTPDMGERSVEMFLGSACVRSTAWVDRMDDRSAAPTSLRSTSRDPRPPAFDEVGIDATFVVAASELPAVIAALDQVLEDPLYGNFALKGELGSGYWGRPVIEAGWVRVHGPVVAASARSGGRSVELSYPHIAELRYALADFAIRTRPGRPT